MTDRWSDLSLWPAKAEVSPLREEHVHEWTDGPDDEEAWYCPGCGVTEYPDVPPFGSERAVARSTDPGTSWEAARSITPEKLRESQELVLGRFQMWGPMTDEMLVYRMIGHKPTLTPSGIRTRRSELVAMGLVRDSGHKDVLRSGRRAIVWEAV